MTRLPPSGALLQCTPALLFVRAESVSRAKANIMIIMSCLDDSTAKDRLANIGLSWPACLVLGDWAALPTFFSKSPGCTCNRVHLSVCLSLGGTIAANSSILPN